jgi:hypothetical protein
MHGFGSILLLLSHVSPGPHAEQIYQHIILLTSQAAIHGNIHKRLGLRRQLPRKMQNIYFGNDLNYYIKTPLECGVLFANSLAAPLASQC